MDRMKELVDKLNRYAYEYYVLDNPTISDKEYDVLYDKLSAMEKETGIVLDTSPTKKVGGEVITAFERVSHRQRLYSLDKAQNNQQLYDWLKRINKIYGEKMDFTVEHKYDGLTLNLTYENGKFIRAVTRGNGVYGENVTAQVLTIKSLPHEIPFKGIMEVQGEGIMYLSKLKRYNETAVEPLKNARNAVAGAIRNLDPKVTASRNLDIIFYAINYIEGKVLENQEEVFEFLRENLFNCSKYVHCYDIESVISEINEIEKNKANLDFLIDGAVVKVNDFKARESLGYTDKFPRWAIAYKYEAEEVTTILNDVVWNVGRTGKVTPLALLEAVELSGATVRRATLNNFSDIQRKKVLIGCRVLVRRSNDVIPEILGSTEIYEGNQAIEKPTNCPSCESVLHDDGINLYCKNTNDCPSQITGRLEHFASKDAMDIEGLSEMTAKQFYENLGVKQVSDLYMLTKENLLSLPKFKEKKAENILKAIEKSKITELSDFIYALAIPNIGKKSAKDLADEFKTLENILAAEKEQILKIPDFGDIMAESVLQFFSDSKNKQVIDKLLQYGIKIKENKTITSGKLSGEKIVITGTLKDFTRSEITKIVEELGAQVQSAVSKSTTMLICGEDAGSKLSKAKSLDIRIVYENEIDSIIG